MTFDRRESDVRVQLLTEAFTAWIKEVRDHREALDRRLLAIENKQDCLTRTINGYKEFLREGMENQKAFEEYKKTGVKAVITTSSVAALGAACAAAWMYFKKALGLI